jgi:DNA repair protein RadC
MAISDWPKAERPRERLIKQGAAALSDAELLAIFLRVGIPGKTAVDLARELLAQFSGDLARLGSASPAELSRLPGVGPAKAAQLLASLELARRALTCQLSSSDILGSPQAVRDWLRLRLAPLPHEVFLTLWLDAGNRLIAAEELFRGTLTSTSVHPREVVKQALAYNAAAVIIAHNHPSGRREASASDIFLTRSLKEALALIDVRLLDHFIVAPGDEPLSLAETGAI